MKRVLDISLSSILLILMLLGTAGVSVEKCSCSGKLTLRMLSDAGCCPTEGNCMVVKTLALADYIPTTVDAVDIPAQPVLFQIIPDIVLLQSPALESSCYCGGFTDSSGPVGTTIEILRN